jgi:cytidylate kinase
MKEVQLNLSRLKGKFIAIDGPAGSGKSTTAKILAARLGYTYLDTGAMYRALTSFALSSNIELSDEKRLTSLAKGLPIEFETSEDVNKVSINGIDVTTDIRTPQVTRAVSEVSAHKGVREAMVAKQRAIAKRGSIVAEGRDTTTVVFPDADIKIYMDASVTQRAQRRLLDLARLGASTSLEEQIKEIERRDKYDSERANSPLTKSRDAYVIDTSDLTIEEQVDRIIKLIRSLLKGR